MIANPDDFAKNHNTFDVDEDLIVQESNGRGNKRYGAQKHTEGPPNTESKIEKQWISDRTYYFSETPGWTFYYDGCGIDINGNQRTYYRWREVFIPIITPDVGRIIPVAGQWSEYMDSLRQGLINPTFFSRSIIINIIDTTLGPRKRRP